MNLSIQTAALIKDAAHFAGELASRARHAVGFDEVLNQPQDAKSAVKPEEFADAVRTRLSEAGIPLAANQTLNIGVQHDGTIQVDSDHPQAAQIESILNGDPFLASKARQLYRGSGHYDEVFRVMISSDLTRDASLGNILQAPGGYPNW